MQIRTKRRIFSVFLSLLTCHLIFSTAVSAKSVTVLIGRQPPQVANLLFAQRLTEFLSEKGLEATIDVSASARERRVLYETKSRLLKLFNQARDSIDTLEIDQGLEYLATFKAEINALSIFTTSHAQLTEAGFILDGIAKHLIGEEKQAIEAFRNALALNPKAELPPSYKNPNIQTTFDSAQESSMTSPGSKTTINTSPQGALVLHNGVPLGHSPIVIEGLATGIHFITATHVKRRSSTTQLFAKTNSRQSTVMLKLHEGEEEPSISNKATTPRNHASLVDQRDCQPSPSSILLGIKNHENGYLLTRRDCVSGTVTEKLFTSKSDSQAALAKIMDWLSTSETTSVPPPQPRFSSWPFWSGSMVGLGLIVGGSALGYQATQAEKQYYSTSRGSPGLNHSTTTDQVEGHAVAARGAKLAIGADLAIGVGIGTLISVILFELLETEAEIKTTSRASAKGTSFEVSISF